MLVIGRAPPVVGRHDMAAAPHQGPRLEEGEQRDRECDPYPHAPPRGALGGHRAEMRRKHTARGLVVGR